MKKTVIMAVVLLCLIVLGVVCIRPVKAQYQGDITINADGSISPSTAPIQQTGNTYTLTGGLDGSLSISKDNVIVNGNGYTLYGGISLNQVSGITVKDLVVDGGEQIGAEPYGLVAGIYLGDSSNVSLVNNRITGISNFLAAFEYYETVAGIIVSGGHSNIISDNDLVNNFEGMQFENTTHNLIVGNNIILNGATESKQGYNDPAGVYFEYSSNNKIYHNNFEISNDQFGDVVRKAKDSYYDSVNVWDDGYPAGGNYWLNYNATEIGTSGIGNKPYFIDGSDNNSTSVFNIDRYPLMEPFNSSFYELQTSLPIISILSPLNQTYAASTMALTFSVDVLSPVKNVNWTGYSLDRHVNVTITSNNILTNVTVANVAKGLNSITVYANASYGNMGASTIAFTVAIPESFPTATVAVVSVVVAAAVVAGLLVYFKKRRGQT
jgi:hypothetical protein